MGKNNKNKGGSDKWHDFKIGKSFSAQDIKRATKAGFSQNQTLKMAASAPFVKNSANKALTSFNSAYTNPTAAASGASGYTSQKGSANLLASYINYRQRDAAGNKDPKKVLGWNGVNANGRANALTINKPDQGRGGIFGGYTSSDGKGNSYGQWATPLKIQDKLNGPSIGGEAAAPSSPSGGGPAGGGEVGDGAGGPALDPLLKENTSIAGFDSSINDSVTSFRRKRSKARMSGLTSKGTSQFKIGGQSSRSSGVNLGIG